MHAGAPPRAGHAAAAASRVRGGACAGLEVREQAQEGRLRSESRYDRFLHFACVCLCNLASTKLLFSPKKIRQKKIFAKK